MTPVTILQSAAKARPDWVGRCMTSVADWSQRHGYSYHCIGDELFEWVTPGLRAKLHDRTPILADLARLRWIEAELSERGGLVVWIDADTLVLDPIWRVPDSMHTFFGEECWVQPTADGSWRSYQSPHNAFMGFTAASPRQGRSHLFPRPGPLRSQPSGRTGGQHFHRLRACDGNCRCRHGYP